MQSGSASNNSSGALRCQFCQSSKFGSVIPSHTFEYRGCPTPKVVYNTLNGSLHGICSMVGCLNPDGFAMLIGILLSVHSVRSFTLVWFVVNSFYREIVTIDIFYYCNFLLQCAYDNYFALEKYCSRTSSSRRCLFAANLSSRHLGQPVELFDRLQTWVHQECPFSHRHHTGVPLVCAMLSGVSGRFFSVSHSFKILCLLFSSQ